jgi:hypothetical protein
MLIKFFIPLLILNFNEQTSSREKIELFIELNYNNEKIVLNKAYQNNYANNFSINKLQLYITDLRFYKENKEVLEYHKKYILIDIENENSLKISIPSNLIFDKVLFNIGIDEETNKTGAKGGDLDPIHGMYWTWNSGYINFKLEGLYNNNNEFMLHIGGFMKPYNTLQKVKINIDKEHNNKLELNFDRFLNSLDFNLDKILSPGKNAVKYSNMLAKSIN